MGVGPNQSITKGPNQVDTITGNEFGVPITTEFAREPARLVHPSSTSFRLTLSAGVPETRFDRSRPKRYARRAAPIAPGGRGAVSAMIGVTSRCALGDPPTTVAALLVIEKRSCSAGWPSLLQKVHASSLA